MSNPAVLLSVSAEFGTPVYVYDADIVARQYHRLTSAFQSHPTRFFYACKALTNVHVLKLIKSLGAGLDCVSINEVKLGLLSGFAPQDILFTPNGVAFEELLEGKRLGIRLNIDNLSQLDRFGNLFGGSYPICIRINPHIEAGGNYKISTGHIDSKFGISIHQVRHIERIVKATGLHVEGIHMHTGSEIKDVDVFLRGLDVLMSVAERFDTLSFLDLGSGFKVPYRPEEQATDVEELGRRVTETFGAWQKETGRSTEIWFEPGKFLVSESGSLLVRANMIKQTTATVFVGVDSGFNQLIRPMFYDAYHHITNLSNPGGDPRIYTVVGNVCETDTFAWDRVLPEVDEGDILCFHNAGAYGFEMSSRFNSRAPLKIRFVKRGDSFFRRQAKSKAHSRGSVTEIWQRIRRNESRMPSSVLQSVLAENDSRKEFLEVPSRTRPAEVLIENGMPRLIRRRETFEDLLTGQIGVEQIAEVSQA